jgi:hypothetical protein
VDEPIIFRGRENWMSEREVDDVDAEETFWRVLHGKLDGADDVAGAAAALRVEHFEHHELWRVL